MGFISTRVLPGCGSMFVCCPALRPSSRQPVKRYKKLLAEIFPKRVNGPPSERKITKLCEYAVRNPIRVPKIAKYLEQRTYKELRSEHIKFLMIITETYSKLLCMCKEQMAYFAVSLSGVIPELLDSTRKDAIRILGCQTLTRFIYSQADGTYTYTIESLARKVCAMARESGEDKRCLRASSLQCLSAMVWFMAEFSHIFTDFDEIVQVTLDNYWVDANLELDDKRGESHHNWVDGVVKREARGSADVRNGSPSYTVVKPRPEKKDPSMLTREEIETPKVWAQICIQKMVELAKESTTMRRVLDPMLIYFDTGRNWAPHHGLAKVVLSDMSYFAEDSGIEQLILAAIIRHVDHKNVAHDPQIKSDIIQIATALARQLRSHAAVDEIGVVSDLCRHLRKSLKAIVELVGQQESDWNVSLQNCIEDCLFEIVKGISDARPLFNIMAITLEKLPHDAVVSRATIGSMLILAHIISLASAHSYSQQVFPEGLLPQLTKSMMHSDAVTRIGAHRIFAVLLVPTSSHPRYDFASFQSEYFKPRRWQSETVSASASASALLKKLRREKECAKLDKHANDAHDEFKYREIVDEDQKHGWVCKRSPNFYKISCSIIDRTSVSTCSADTESNIVKLSEDQMAQLLSAFWVQANLPDNLPSNFEALSHSFNLTLVSSHMKNTNHSLVARFFHLPLSLRKASLDYNSTLPFPCQRSLFTLSTAMLIFVARSYQIPELIDFVKSHTSMDVDPYLSIGDDSQVYVKPQADEREYGSVDEEAAVSSLAELRTIVGETDKDLEGIIVQNLCAMTELDVDDLVKEMSETFTLDDTFLFSPPTMIGLDHIRAIGPPRKLLSFDEDFSASLSIDDDVSELSVVHPPHFIPTIPASPSLPHMISVTQLLESALEVAGQVAGASVSNSPRSYSTMASQCEALGTGTRNKLSSWLSHDLKSDKLLLTFPANGQSVVNKEDDEEPKQDGLSSKPWMALRLPPASPFDNFLKAAGC
ncbi:protein EFR3 A-like protein isoform X2 [Cinnamomum micranthum f. kanehirae]|uniref:Protein EFR3 A-like protein isoform X2 n=1 Tax=Cinnamomum micranthum f. kanehirae TaxID=337451 RepID=A0A443PWS0_9MAGN|nr:protein EFR3 A-like protein isoform X2 [Cinnamomum micranthum f. kanehirae]